MPNNVKGDLEHGVLRVQTAAGNNYSKGENTMAGIEDLTKAVESQTQAIEHLCGLVHALITRYEGLQEAIIAGLADEDETHNPFGSLSDASGNDTQT